ncbi:hypothetical protein CgunFtcFv8_015881 [Champsocephalus gunnari]|uniref:Uncharacterized protein n=1 Tax=Champsocephalus gunnari TaxID=52237 RepID=A0AAN8C6T4_CHAGU|nr:hypothetical protein CgunFtcFv8_015881 [Champsocephalus gunnari]
MEIEFNVRTPSEAGSSARISEGAIVGNSSRAAPPMDQRRRWTNAADGPTPPMAVKELWVMGFQRLPLRLSARVSVTLKHITHGIGTRSNISPGNEPEGKRQCV